VSATRVARSIERWAAGWAERRQGPDTTSVRLKRRRIYILPTRFGLLFGVLVFAMLLGSLNYGASLGFALTFVLGAVVLVAMHHCHNNLLGVHVQLAGAQPVFAGQHAEFRIALGNDAQSPRYEIEIAQGAQTAGPADLASGATVVLKLAVPATRRGWLVLGRFAVRTYHPGRLFRAWTWVHMSAQCLVYPTPAPPGRPLPDDFARGGLRGRPAAGDSDFAGLRTAVPADPPQHLAWKAYARTDQLLLKQFSTGEHEPRWLDWDALPDLAPEQRLGQLARWCLDAHANDRGFGLRLPGRRVDLGTGPAHLDQCLRALALYEPPA
jgi:uncharacterized protein (DUF58 family)